jgi:DNA-directed RNA polymerase specialized sigma54-like protein
MCSGAFRNSNRPVCLPGRFPNALRCNLRRKNRLDPAMAALVNNLELLARRDFATLKRLCGVDEEDLLDMLAEIRALDPKPGTRFETGSSELIVPDVSVKTGRRWRLGGRAEP